MLKALRAAAGHKAQFSGFPNTIYYDNTKWQTFDGTWDAGNQWWSTLLNDDIALQELGTWVETFEPVYLHINIYLPNWTDNSISYWINLSNSTEGTLIDVDNVSHPGIFTGVGNYYFSIPLSWPSAGNIWTLSVRTPVFGAHNQIINYINFSDSIEGTLLS